MQLPKDYASFVTNYFDQQLKKKYFKTKDGKVESLLKSFISRQDVEEYLNKKLGTELPEELLPIAVDPAGNKICIGINGNVYGKIFYWGEDEEYEEHEPSYDCIRLVADSFTEFMNGLTETR